MPGAPNSMASRILRALTQGETLSVSSPEVRLLHGVPLDHQAVVAADLSPEYEADATTAPGYSPQPVTFDAGDGTGRGANSVAVQVQPTAAWQFPVIAAAICDSSDGSVVTVTMLEPPLWPKSAADTIVFPPGSLAIDCNYKYPMELDWRPRDLPSVEGWWHAGEKTEGIELNLTPFGDEQPLIWRLVDYSWKGRALTSSKENFEWAGIRVGLDLDPGDNYPDDPTNPWTGRQWSCNVPMIAIKRYQRLEPSIPEGPLGHGCSYRMAAPVNFGGEFYFWAMVCLTRDGGVNTMWVGSGPGDEIRIDYTRQVLTLRMGGSATVDITPAGAVPLGPVLLEVYRDASNVVHVRANTVEIGSDLVLTGSFEWLGFGWDGVPGSTDDWQDYLFELGGASAAPSANDFAEMWWYANQLYQIAGPEVVWDNEFKQKNPRCTGDYPGGGA